MIAPYPPLEAYRLDIATRPATEVVAGEDDQWLALAIRTARAAHQRERGVIDVSEALRYAVGDGEHDADELAMLGRLQLAAESMEAAGMLQLAYVMLVAARRLAEPVHPLAAGRSLAVEARIFWKRGDLAGAESLYRELGLRARRAALPELRIRQLLGLGVVAQLRGNYPAVRCHARAALRLLTAQDDDALASVAHQLLMRAAAAAEDVSGAILHGWSALTQARGDPPRAIEMLLNLSQLLVEAGHATAAMAGFREALARTHDARLRMPALGGLAIAAAAQGDPDTARESIRLILTECAGSPFPYQAASAFVDAEVAARGIGDAALAARAHGKSTALVDRFRYHELSYRLAGMSAIVPLVVPRPLAPSAANVVATFEHLLEAGLVTA